jgi:hypothetical protein
MALSFPTRYDGLYDLLVPYLVATPMNLPHLNTAPFGLAIPPEHVIDPLRMASEPFLLLLQTLDAATFGPEGMPMPRWVFYDCSELPGAIFGFARHARDLDPEARRVFGVPAGYDGLVPHSMYIAIPMFEAGSWFGHNLCSIAPVLSHLPLKGLGSVTKAVALEVFGTERLYGATQWDSHALFIHVKFGPLDLMTAYTPAHSEAMTLTYDFLCTEEALRSAAGDPTVTLVRPAPERWIRQDDEAAVLALQREIEAGARFRIPTAPRVDAGALFVPITRVSAP